MGQIFMSIGAALLFFSQFYAATLCEKNESGTFLSALFFMPFALKKAREHGFYGKYFGLFASGLVAICIGAGILSA